MATERLRTVGPSKNYASLNAWEAGEEADLVALDEFRVAECYSFQDTTAVIIAGSTTDATRYMEVRVPTVASVGGTNERHDGKWNTSKYYLSVSGGAGEDSALDCRQGYTRFLGIQVEGHTPTVSMTTLGCSAINGTTIYLESCILRTHTSATLAGSCLDISGTVSWKAKNCVMHDRTTGGNGRGFSTDSATSYIHNCTVYSVAGTGIRGFSGTINVKNTVSVAAVCFTNSGTTFTKNNVITSDDTADDDGGSGNQINITEASMHFTSVSGSDFHIDATSSLKDQGQSLSGDSNLPVTDDIDGQTRSGTFDVGADELAAAGNDLSVNSIGEAVVGGSVF